MWKGSWHCIYISSLFQQAKECTRWVVWDLCLIYLFLILWILDFLETIEDILPSLPEGISVWAMTDSVPQGITSLKEKLNTASDCRVPRSHHAISNTKTPYLYIFTSGTTGMIHLFVKLKKNAVYYIWKATGLDKSLPCVAVTKQRTWVPKVQKAKLW